MNPFLHFITTKKQLIIIGAIASACYFLVGFLSGLPGLLDRVLELLSEKKYYLASPHILLLLMNVSGIPLCLYALFIALKKMNRAIRLFRAEQKSSSEDDEETILKS